MIGKFLFLLSAATATFLGLSAGAVTTSQNIDIIVTHGAPLTTFTFVNNTGNTLPAGSPVSFGQAFRYGDVMPGTYPLIRDASTHVALPGQQWDEISTWRENGGNGSWRHAVWAAWLPNSLANGATYQVEFDSTAGTYSESSHQALSALCSGPAAHDLKIHLTDVRNLNDTVRDSATRRLGPATTSAMPGATPRAICAPATSMTSTRSTACSSTRAATRIRCSMRSAMSTSLRKHRTASRRAT